MLSTFPAIDTVVDNIKFSQGLEQLAEVMDRGTLIRSYTAGDLGFILHSRHQYHWHTGYAPPQTVAAPHLGAIVARTLGPLDPGGARVHQHRPALGRRRRRGAEGVHHGRFPRQRVRPVQHPVPGSGRGQRAAAGRHDARPLRGSRHVLPASCSRRARSAQHGSEYQQDSLLRAYDNAHRLLSSPAAKAFDLSLEPMEHVRKYVPGYEPGQQFDATQRSLRREVRAADGRPLRPRLPAGAAARAKSGARFIEVTTEYIPFLNWDTHENGHTRIAEMKQQIDAPIAQLVLDLEERGLLDRTLIVLASEFSRDMMIEGKPDQQGEGSGRRARRRSTS